MQLYRLSSVLLVILLSHGNVLLSAPHVVLRRGISLVSKRVVRLRSSILNNSSKAAGSVVELFSRNHRARELPHKIIFAASAPSPIDHFLSCAVDALFYGGHTVEQHIAITDGQLQKRLLGSVPISAATKFTDHQTAVSAVRDSLRANADAIAQWLDSAFSEMKCYYRHERPIGYGFRADKHRLPHIKYLYHSCMVLQKKANSFCILTAYPLALKV
ncbi:hypothetical protein FJ365_04815 [Candidatus Dependentiae bacterium]|nr:hypothetical protein [Candidatus Dependentiae bacterium]